ncbi:MAG: hypothetical protein LBU90_01670 [Bacteroidales bacterium]|jgi:hypothetical protein|nr:hypothetical protein [Bacteroidales bacterium]
MITTLLTILFVVLGWILYILFDLWITTPTKNYKPDLSGGIPPKPMNMPYIGIFY